LTISIFWFYSDFFFKLINVFTGKTTDIIEEPFPEEEFVTSELGVVFLENTNSFEVIDSEYLNINVQSSEIVNGTVSSIPETIEMGFFTESVESTDLTISGLSSSTTYYMYSSYAEEVVEFTTDESGSYTWDQLFTDDAISLWIQTEPSTVLLGANGVITCSNTSAYYPDCDSVVQWDSENEEYFLTEDFTETIQFNANGITLDCAGFLITGTGTGNGIYAPTRYNYQFEH